MSVDEVTRMRSCRIRNCTYQHERSKFCCRGHWYQLPKPMRDAIWAAFRGPGVLSAEYLQAAENATAFLENREPRDTSGVFS